MFDLFSRAHVFVSIAKPKSRNDAKQTRRFIFTFHSDVRVLLLNQPNIKTSGGSDPPKQYCFDVINLDYDVQKL